MSTKNGVITVLLAVTGLFLSGIFFVSHVHSAEVTLAWKANINPAVSGYNLYYGTSSRNYSVCLDVGKVLQHTVTGLVPGKKYYFAVTTYTATSESKYSLERAYVVPVASVASASVASISKSALADGANASTVLEADSRLFSPNLSPSYSTDYNGREILYPPHEGGMTELTFEVPAAGDYVLWMHRKTDGSSRNSVLLSTDHTVSTSWTPAISSTGEWMWERVDQPQNGQPSWLHLETGIHTLAIEPLEGDVSIDRLLLSPTADFIPRTVYENGQNAASWLAGDSNSRKGGITGAFDQERRCNVVQLSGSDIRDRFLLGAVGAHRWRNNKQFVLEWSMKCSEPFAAEVLARTTTGTKTIRYLPADNLRSGNGNLLRIGLGVESGDGTWRKIARNLQADLSLLDPEAELIEVNGFVFRGSGRVGDVLLREF